MRILRNVSLSDKLKRVKGQGSLHHDHFSYGKIEVPGENHLARKSPSDSQAGTSKPFGLKYLQSHHSLRYTCVIQHACITGGAGCRSLVPPLGDGDCSGFVDFQNKITKQSHSQTQWKVCNVRSFWNSRTTHMRPRGKESPCF